MALVINQSFRGRDLVRAFLLLPFIVPTILSVVAWMWIFDPTFSVINWVLVHSGMITSGFSWLGNATLSMVSIIIVNTGGESRSTASPSWPGSRPFLPTSTRRPPSTGPPSAAVSPRHAADHQADPDYRDHVLGDLHLPDFQIVYALTHGGPANATQVFVTYAFDLGMSGGQLGMGAAAALAMLPALAVMIVALTLYMRREP